MHLSSGSRLSYSVFFCVGIVERQEKGRSFHHSGYHYWLARYCYGIPYENDIIEFMHSRIEFPSFLVFSHLEGLC